MINDKVNVVQLFICILCEFAIIPANSLFGQEVIADKGRMVESDFCDQVGFLG